MANYSDSKNFRYEYVGFQGSQVTGSANDPIVFYTDQTDTIEIDRLSNPVSSDNEYAPYEISYTFIENSTHIAQISYYGADPEEEDYLADPNQQPEIFNSFSYIMGGNFSNSNNDMLFRDVANVTFKETATTDPGMIVIMQLDGDYRDRDNDPQGETTFDGRPALSKGLPLPGWDIKTISDILVNADNSAWQLLNGSPNGTASFKTLIEEVLHSLGADIYYGADENNKPIIQDGIDSFYDIQKYTVSSYNIAPSMTAYKYDPWIGIYSEYVFPHSLQLMDIAAIQDLYGRNFDKKSDNTVWSVTDMLPAGKDVTDAFLYSIWDGGGIDTIDASAMNNLEVEVIQAGLFGDNFVSIPIPSEIDLRQGKFSTLGVNAQGEYLRYDSQSSGETDDPGNVSIAYYAVIENARGTKWGDILIGNAWDNELRGENGDDTLYGDGDVYDGDAGFHEDDPQRSSSNPQTSAAVDDSGVDTLIGGKGSDIVYGGKGNDILIASANSGVLGGFLEGDIYDGGRSDGAFAISVASDGDDTLDYSNVSIGGITVEYNTSETQFEIYQSSAFFQTNDIARSIEEFILTSDSDTLDFSDGLPAQETRFDGGEGDLDLIDFSGRDSGLTIHQTDMNGLRSIGPIKFKGFEKIAGSDSHNDVFYGGTDSIIFDANGQEAETIGDLADYRYLVDPTGQAGSVVGFVDIQVTAATGADTIKAVVQKGASAAGLSADLLLDVEAYVGSEGDDTFQSSEGLVGIIFDGLGQSSGGRDIVDFSSYTSGLTINLSGTITDIQGGTLLLVNIEDIIGTQYADTISGLSTDEWLRGYGGDDVINGNGGADAIFGGTGYNQLSGGTGGDVFVYDQNDADPELDDIEGGGGTDTILLIGALNFIYNDFSRDSSNVLTINEIGTTTQNDVEYIEFGDGALFALDTLGKTLPVFTIDESHIAEATSAADNVQGEDDDNDRFFGSDNADTIDGGVGGYDEMSYADTAPVYDTQTGMNVGIVYQSGVVTKPPSGGIVYQDTLTNIEGIVGTEGVDIIIGSSADEQFFGGADDDDIEGGGGNDVLYDGEGNDIVQGGADDDWIISEDTDQDLLYGDDGSDHIYAATDDLAFGGDGTDFLFGLDNATLDGGSGNDYLEGEGSVKFIESTGTDVILATGTNNELVLTTTTYSSVDFRRAENGSLVIVKSNGDKIIIVDHFNGSPLDYVSNDGMGTVSLASLLTDVDPYNTELDESLVGSSGNNYYNAAGAGNDIISSGGGTNDYVFDSSNYVGQTAISAAAGGASLETIILNGASSTDDFELIRYNNASHLNLDYGAGSITLVNAGSQAAQYQVQVGSTGTYAISALGFVSKGSTNSDTLNGDLIGWSPDDTIYGLEGDDEINGGDGADSIFGGSGADILNGDDGNDTLDGGTGNDEIFGGAGADILIDSQGNDEYVATTDDRLFVGSGDNVLTSTMADMSSFTIDFTDFGYDNVSELGFIRNFSTARATDINAFLNEDVVLSYGGHTLTLDEYYNYTVLPDVTLHDGTTLSLGALEIIGYGSDDAENPDYYSELTFGVSLSDTIYAQAGNDVFEFLDGDDVVYGGEGDDLLGKIFSFEIDSGTGDILFVPDGTGTLVAYGEAGDDILRGGIDNDELYGGDGNDALWDIFGGTNVLDGGAGDDIFLLGKVGQSTVIGGHGYDIVDVSSANYIDTVNSTFTINLSTQEVTTGSTLHTLSSVENAIGSEQNDTIIGSAGANAIDGFLGNDLLQGGLGDDSYRFGQYEFYDDYGDDTIFDAGGDNDSISFGTNIVFEDLSFAVDSDDLLINYHNSSVRIQDQFVSSGIFQIEKLVFSDGSSVKLPDYLDWVVGDDTDNTAMDGTNNDDILYGLDGDDTINGLDGQDALHGGNGDDNLNGGNGDDILNGGLGSNALDGGAGYDTASYDSLEFAIEANFVLETVVSSLEVSDNLTSVEGVIGTIYDDTIISGSGGHTIDGYYGSDTVDYSASTSKVEIDLHANTTSGGYAANDVLISIENLIGSDLSSEKDKLYGNAADNTLLGLAGGDFLNGRGGADYIDGGDGWDSVLYVNSAVGVLVNLETNANQSGDAEGDLLFNIEAVTGSAHNDAIFGNSSNNYISGRNGDDYLSGGGGFDTLAGDAGDDTYLYEEGDVIISDSSGVDRLVFGANWIPQDVIVNGDYISFSGSTENINIGSGILSIEEFQFWGQDVIDLQTLQSYNPNATPTGDANDNVFLATVTAEAFDGQGGSDTVSYEDSNEGVNVNLKNSTGDDGYADNDSYTSIENVIGSDDRDYIWGSEDDNEIYGGAGNDLLEGDGGADILDGGSGFDYARYILSSAGVTIDLENNIASGGDAEGDTLISIEAVTGSHQNDVLRGGAGNEYLIGGGGDDILNGGSTGLDTLYGGAGLDTFVFEAGSVGSVADNISDFTVADGDVLDLIDLFTVQYDETQDVITDFIQFTDNGSNTLVQIDADGGGDSFVDAINLGGVTGLDEATLYASDQLLLNDTQV